MNFWVTKQGTYPINGGGEGTEVNPASSTAARQDRSHHRSCGAMTPEAWPSTTFGRTVKDQDSAE